MAKQQQQHHHILKKFLVSAVGFGLVLIGYLSWRIYQDFRILKNIQNQQEQLSRYRQQAEQKPEEPEAWLQLGDATFGFWQNAGRGIRIAKEVNQMNLVWEWLGAKNSALQQFAINFATEWISENAQSKDHNDGTN